MSSSPLMLTHVQGQPNSMPRAVRGRQVSIKGILVQVNKTRSVCISDLQTNKISCLSSSGRNFVAISAIQPSIGFNFAILPPINRVQPPRSCQMQLQESPKSRTGNGRCQTIIRKGIYNRATHFIYLFIYLFI